ncbi:uncharacterized protein LOC131820040 [Mustela lutreola]|uniref:uncharacterized protein LOC131820040 n=1 Tax=Mustela lutreola TaxID=9666 RepID=UPI0027973AA0|nr:uncharacterized protein LOC131820040 [Mustela lutreola]
MGGRHCSTGFWLACFLAPFLRSSFSSIGSCCFDDPGVVTRPQYLPWGWFYQKTNRAPASCSSGNQPGEGAVTQVSAASKSQPSLCDPVPSLPATCPAPSPAFSLPHLLLCLLLPLSSKLSQHPSPLLLPLLLLLILPLSVSCSSCSPWSPVTEDPPQKPLREGTGRGIARTLQWGWVLSELGSGPPGSTQRTLLEKLDGGLGGQAGRQVGPHHNTICIDPSLLRAGASRRWKPSPPSASREALLLLGWSWARNNPQIWTTRWGGLAVWAPWTPAASGYHRVPGPAGGLLRRSPRGPGGQLSPPATASHTEQPFPELP